MAQCTLLISVGVSPRSRYKFAVRGLIGAVQNTDPGVEQRGDHVLAWQPLDGGSFARGLLDHDHVGLGRHRDGGDLSRA